MFGGHLHVRGAAQEEREAARYNCQPHCREPAGAGASCAIRVTQPSATSICAIVAAACAPGSRGVHPASSCCARSAATTTNSKGFV